MEPDVWPVFLTAIQVALTHGIIRELERAVKPFVAALDDRDAHNEKHAQEPEEDMENDHALTKLDSSIAILQDARDLYIQKKYQDAYDRIKKADRPLRHARDEISCLTYMSDEDRRLTEEEESKLVAMNAALADLERKITAEVDRIRGLCEQRLASPEEPFLQDYEIDVEMAFWVGEDHPAYVHNFHDNIIATLEFRGRKDLFGIGENWNDRFGDDRYHCSTFHSLYDHTIPKLSWHDILQINHVSVDIIVRYQRFVDL